jgi:ankyrin repeat protein
MLLGKGANILAATKTGMNPLHGAVEGNKVDTVRALMEFCTGKDELKASLTNAKNSDDKTPWDIAFGTKNQAVCGVLKEMGDANGASSSCVIA